MQKEITPEDERKKKAQASETIITGINFFDKWDILFSKSLIWKRKIPNSHQTLVLMFWQGFFFKKT